MDNLYENIKLLCDEQGIKGGKMCDDLGITRNLLGELRSGRQKRISTQTAMKIANYFNVPIEAVLYGRSTTPEQGSKKKESPAEENPGEADTTAVTAELQRFRDVDRGLLEVTRDMTIEEVKLLTRFAEELKKTNRGY